MCFRCLLTLGSTWSRGDCLESYILLVWQVWPGASQLLLQIWWVSQPSSCTPGSRTWWEGTTQQLVEGSSSLGLYHVLPLCLCSCSCPRLSINLLNKCQKSSGSHVEGMFCVANSVKLCSPFAITNCTVCVCEQNKQKNDNYRFLFAAGSNAILYGVWSIGIMFSAMWTPKDVRRRACPSVTFFVTNHKFSLIKFKPSQPKRCVTICIHQFCCVKEWVVFKWKYRQWQ